MRALKKVKLQLPFLRVIATLFLVLALLSCGNGHSDSPYGDVTEYPDVDGDNPYSDPYDTDIISLGMSVSIDYASEGSMVTCYVNVFDQNGDFVDTMNPGNFEIVANNVIITESYRTFDTTQSSINLVGLILDSSGSMDGEKMAASKVAAKMFVDTMSGSDQTALVDFDDNARLALPLTTSKTSLKTAIDALIADGSTNIRDGIITCVDAVGSRPGKTAGILLTDGENNVGTVDDGIAKAKMMRMPIYSIFLGTGISALAKTDMQKIADETGGVFYETATASELQYVFSTVIPQALAAKPPRKSYEITFQNIYPAYTYVEVLFTLRYFNAWGMHTADFTASYYVTQSEQ